MIHQPVVSMITGAVHGCTATVLALVTGFFLSTACGEWWAMLFILALYAVHKTENTAVTEAAAETK